MGKGCKHTGISKNCRHYSHYVDIWAYACTIAIMWTLKPVSALQPFQRYRGALGGVSPMSPIDFKKWQCPRHYFLKFPVEFEIV